MLVCEIDVAAPPADGATVLVLLHGRGSDRFDLLGLRRGLPDDVILVTPEAPFPAAPWGYGPGSAWYRFLGDDRPEPESFEEAQWSLAEFLEHLPDQLPVAPGVIALGGFSQGGTMSLAHALRQPENSPCVLNFSGFLASHPGVAITPESVRGTRIFWGHGTKDPAIPFAMALAGRAKLESVGADLTARDYSIGHWIDPGELNDAVEWLRATVTQVATD